MHLCWYDAETGNKLNEGWTKQRVLSLGYSLLSGIIMFDVLLAVGICVFGYLSGSLPFALWITRLVKGVDVRDAGSGHASTTNTIRQAGWGPGILVLIFDIGKGYLPTLMVDFFPNAFLTVLTDFGLSWDLLSTTPTFLFCHVCPLNLVYTQTRFRS